MRIFAASLGTETNTFAPIAAEISYVDCGGTYPPDPAKIVYTKVRRPIAPLDPNPLVG